MYAHHSFDIMFDMIFETRIRWILVEMNSYLCCQVCRQDFYKKISPAFVADWHTAIFDEQSVIRLPLLNVSDDLLDFAGLFSERVSAFGTLLSSPPCLPGLVPQVFDKLRPHCVVGYF